MVPREFMGMKSWSDLPFAALSAALALALSAAPAGAAASLVGTWFGTGQPDDKGAMYLDHLLPDGRVHSQFRSCIKGKAVDSTEDGTWVVAGDIRTVTVITHDGLFLPRIDHYRIVSLAADRYREVYIPLNFAYDSRRVDAKFTMPSCELVS